jgi:hypothetical protein
MGSALMEGWSAGTQRHRDRHRTGATPRHSGRLRSQPRHGQAAAGGASPRRPRPRRRPGRRDVGRPATWGGGLSQGEVRDGGRAGARGPEARAPAHRGCPRAAGDDEAGAAARSSLRCRQRRHRLRARRARREFHHGAGGGRAPDSTRRGAAGGPVGGAGRGADLAAGHGLRGAVGELRRRGPGGGAGR